MSKRINVWPNGMPSTGQPARRSRDVTSRDIELFTAISGDRNPLHYGTAVCYTMPLEAT